MTNLVEIIGIYPVIAEEPVHLVELWVRDSTAKFEIGEFTQELVNEPRDNWQSPYDERILDSVGERIKADPWQDNGEEIWQGDVRVAFFFHNLDLSLPLKTPFGEMSLPDESEQPKRLKMEYLAP